MKPAMWSTVTVIWLSLTMISLGQPADRKIASKNSVPSIMELYGKYLTPQNEVMSRRDITTQHYRIDDHTNVALIHSNPVFFINRDRMLEPISNSIIQIPEEEQAGYSYRNEANDVSFYFSGDATTCQIVDAGGKELAVLKSSFAAKGGMVSVLDNRLEKILDGGMSSIVWSVQASGLSCRVLTKGKVDGADQHKPLAIDWRQEVILEAEPLHRWNNGSLQTTTITPLEHPDQRIHLSERTVMTDTTTMWDVQASLTAVKAGSVLKSSRTATPIDAGPILYIQNLSDVGCIFGYRAWVKYDLSSLYCATAVSWVEQRLFTKSYKDGWPLLDWIEYDVTGLAVDPETTSAENLWYKIIEGTPYDENNAVEYANHWESSIFEVAARSDLFAAIASRGYFAVGLMVKCNEDDSDFYADFMGSTEANPPYLIVVYTPTHNTAAVSLLSPPDGAAGIPLHPTLAWDSVDEAFNYQLQIDGDNSFSVPLYDVKAESTVWAEPCSLSHSENYYWRVRAYSCGGEGGWSNIRHFTTVGSPLVTPVLGSPPTGSECQQVPVPVRWKRVNGVGSYSLCVAADSFYHKIVFLRRGITDTLCSVNKLPPPATYYWKVQVNLDTLQSAWSEKWKFTTLVGIPQLLSPDDRFTSNYTCVELVWDSVQGMTSYYVQVSKYSSFLQADEYYPVVNHMQICGSGGDTLYWRVQARETVCGDGGWSTARTIFIANGAAGVGGDHGFPRSYVLFQNYPNPFNPTTSIRYGLPRSGHIRLSVFNTLGIEVAVLADGQQLPGYHEAVLNASDYPSGVYYYRFLAQNYVALRKLVILK